MKGLAGKRSLKLHMIRSKSGRFNKRSHAEKYVKPNYFDTFRYDRLLIILIAIILLVIGVL